MTETVVFEREPEPLTFIGMSDERAFLVECWTCGKEEPQELMSYCDLDNVFYCQSHYPGVDLARYERNFPIYRHRM